MNSFKMKLADMVKPDKNVRIHTEQQLKEFEKSIRMFGQLRPIVVDEDNVILAGNGLYETLKRIGKTEAEVYQYLDLSENQKKKLMIADNKIFSLGIENLDTLNSFLEDLQGDLDIPGFDEEILKQMVSEAVEVTDKISEYGTLNQDEINNIKSNTARKEMQEPKIQDSGSNNEEIIKNANDKTIGEHIQEEQGEQTTEVKKFVLCPKCGEKIWL